MFFFLLSWFYPTFTSIFFNIWSSRFLFSLQRKGFQSFISVSLTISYSVVCWFHGVVIALRNLSNGGEGGSIHKWKLIWYRVSINGWDWVKGHFIPEDVILTPSWNRRLRLRTRYLFQFSGKMTAWLNESSYHVYMISELVFVVEYNFRSGTVTGLNLHRYDSFWNEILRAYHVNSYRNTL